MTAKQTIYADSIVGMSVQDGVVRLDLAVYAGQVKGEDGKSKQRLQVTSQLAIPLKGFISGVAMQQRMVKELAKRQQDQPEESEQ